MERRKFLIGAGSLAAGSAAAIGTGAFTSVEADRSVNVNIAGDASAYLSLTRAQNGTGNAGSTGNPTPNAAEYVEYEGGELAVDIDGTDGDNFGDGSNNDANGLNDNATTTIDDLFDIINRGTQTVKVGTVTSNLPAGVQLYAEDGSNPDMSLDIDDWDDSRQQIAPGEAIEDVGLKFNEGWDQQDFDITIRAEAVDQD